jgi:hypothetical protein
MQFTVLVRSGRGRSLLRGAGRPPGRVCGFLWRWAAVADWASGDWVELTWRNGPLWGIPQRRRKDCALHGATDPVDAESLCGHSRGKPNLDGVEG